MAVAAAGGVEAVDAGPETATLALSYSTIPRPLLPPWPMGVLSVGSSGSCEACFSEGGDKEGVGRGGDDWVSSSSYEMGSLLTGLYG